MMNGE